MAFTELDDGAIQELLSSSRQRGAYDRNLADFWAANQRGVQVNLSEGEFEGKKAQTIKTGFESAAKREGAPEGAKDNLRVIVQNENIYLVRNDLAA